nr:hypothetical protein CFP56_39380 [Quercus suber]
MNSRLTFVRHLHLRVTVKTALAWALQKVEVLNMVMTFVLHPLSHYNSITELYARFLLSLLEDISIDFPSHFILSLIDVYRDTTTRDKLIFPSAITRILRHFSVPFPISDHFHVMCAIDAAIVRQSKA